MMPYQVVMRQPRVCLSEYLMPIAMIHTCRWRVDLCRPRGEPDMLLATKAAS